MKATKAYIASLGTTGVLLGASLLMLAVVSAVVAFDRWPNGHVSARVQTLMLNDEPSRISVSAQATGASATTPATARAPGTTRAAPRATGRAPLATVQPQIPARAPVTAQPANPLKALPPAVGGPLQPVEDASGPLIDTIGNPHSTAGQLADQTQAATDAAGGGAAAVSPQVGSAVAGTGQSAAQTVRSVPLPGS